MSIDSFKKEARDESVLIEKPAGPDFVSRLRDLKSQCKRVIRREQATLEKRIQERDEAGRGTWYRQIADSIMAAPDDFPRGCGECEVINIHTDKIEQVRLNVKFDGIENARLLYKKAKKGERGLTIAGTKVERTTRRIAEINGIVGAIDFHLQNGDVSGEDVASVESKAAQIGIVPASAGPAPGKPSLPKLPFRRYTIDGYCIYIGKNDTQNDDLTKHVARPWDIWMHVALHSGSHVVVVREKNSEWPPRDVLVKAAEMAVWFSKARHTSFAEVHVTEARYVRTPRGHKPGQVIVQQCKTLRVAPHSPGELFGADFEKDG